MSGAQITKKMIEKIKLIIDKTIPAVAVPVGAPAPVNSFFADMPRSSPIIAQIGPMPKGRIGISANNPNTKEATAEPLPGVELLPVLY